MKSVIVAQAPCMLIVAATGDITVATSFKTPASMAEFIVTGSVALLLAVENAVIIAGEINTPILLIHGEKDNVIPPEASKKAYQLIPSFPKELKIYPDLGHNLFFEPGGVKIVTDIVEWVKNLLRENP